MANFADLWEQEPTNKFGGLNEDMSSRLQAANDAWKAKTGRDLPITSGARSAEQGIKLFGERASNPNLVAKPGTSLHEKGMAADISPEVPNAFLDQFGLHRPFGSRDPVHVEINPKSSYAPKSASVTVSGAPAPTNFADLWESTPAAATTTEKAQPKNLQEAMVSAKETMKPIADVGKGLASIADIALGAVPAVVGGATYAGARAFQKSPEEAQALAQKVSAPLESPIGKALGITEDPAYKQEAVRRAMDSIGQYIGESAETISKKTGIPKSDVENMINTLSFAAGEGVAATKGARAKLGAQFEKAFPLMEETTKPSMAGVGAAATEKATFLNQALQTATPELRAELQKLKPEEINLQVLERQMLGDSLPVPMRFTEGQATQNVKLLSDEINQRAKNPEYAYRFNEQNGQLIENINAIKENAAPNVYGTNHVENGQALIDAYKSIDDVRKADIDAKYLALKEAAGGEFPVDGAAFANNAFKSLKKELKSDFIPPAIERQLKRFQEGEPMTFEQFEAMRTNLAAEQRKAARAGDGNTEAAAGIVRTALEDLPLTGAAKDLKPLADEARNAARNRFDVLKQDKAYNAAVNDAVAADDFIQKFVVNGKKADIDTMVNHLGTDSVARETMAAGIVNWLKNKSGIVNDQGNFSQAGYNKALQSIDPKILAIVGPEVNAQLKALGEAARLTQSRPKGSYVNESNTLVGALAEKAKSGAEAGINYAFGGLPVGTMTREAFGKAVKSKQTKESLKPGAGIKLKDIGKE
jgi:hypothetical protein